MPIEEYYKGHGKKVMSDMKKEYGSKKGKKIFYATANKSKMKSMHPSEEVMEKMHGGKHGKK